MGEQDVADQRGAFACRGPAGSNRRARFSFGRGPFVCPGAATPSRFHRCRSPRSTRPRLPPAANVSRRRPVPRARAVPGHDRGAPPSGSMAGRFRHLAKRCLPPTPPVIRHEEEGAVDAGGPSSGCEGASRAARLASRGTGQVIFPRLATKSRTGGRPTMSAPCVDVISFDGTRRLPSWRFRPASKAVCLEPCRRGCGSGVMARRCGNLFWVTSPDLPIRVSSVRRVWIGAHGFLYKTDAAGLCRRVGRS